jgi:hypothetical protein
LSKDLQVGNLLRLTTGKWEPIIEVQVVQKTAATHNFEVEQNHDYFVGENGWLVHNDCTELAIAAQKEAGGGSVVRVTQTDLRTGGQANWLTRPNSLYPKDAAWGYHDVHVNQGMVTDRLSTFGNTPVSFSQWLRQWNQALPPATVNNLTRVQ